MEGLSVIDARDQVEGMNWKRSREGVNDCGIQKDSSEVGRGGYPEAGARALSITQVSKTKFDVDVSPQRGKHRTGWAVR